MIAARSRASLRMCFRARWVSLIFCDFFFVVSDWVLTVAAIPAWHSRRAEMKTNTRLWRAKNFPLVNSLHLIPGAHPIDGGGSC